MQYKVLIFFYYSAMDSNHCPKVVGVNSEPAR